MYMKKVSEYLREERHKRNLSLLDIEQATKIKKEYLAAIESGRFSSLPSHAYALGFVKTYASYLGLSEQKVMALFRRDYGEEHFEVVPQYRKNQHKFDRRFFFSARGIVVLGAILLVVGYIVFQYGPLFVGPALAVTSPKEGSIIRENVFEVKGATDPYAVVLVNQEEAYVDLNGNFKKTVYTFTGEKQIIVVAKNRFGKETKKMITIQVK